MAGPLRAGLLALIAALAGVWLPRAAGACAFCVGGSGEAASAGFYWSAWLLTALPFAILLAVGGSIGRALRRGRR